MGAEKYKKDEFVGSAEQTLTIKDADKVSLNIKVQMFKLPIAGIWGYLQHVQLKKSPNY